MFRKIISALLISALLITAAVPALAATLYATVTTPTTDGALYVRRVAGEGQPIVGSAKFGDQLEVLKKGNTWHRVKVLRTGVTGWVYGKYITFGTATEVNREGSVSSSDGYANFRVGPTTSSAVISKLNNGTKLNVISKTGNWYYVYCASKATHGYVSAGLVKLASAAAAPSDTSNAVISSSDGFANLRKGPGTNYAIVAPLKNGTKAEIVSTSGSWSLVKVPSTNQYGYVYTKLLKAGTSSSGSTAVVNGAYTTGRINSSDGFANFRTGPSTSKSVIAKLYNNVMVSILATDGNWYKVQLSDAGQTGYVYKKLVETVKAEGTMTTTGNVNLRSGPGTGYAKKTVIPKNTTVSVLSTYGNFARVNAKGWIGYISLSYLK